MRWLECQVLAMPRQQIFQIGQRGAGQHRHHQLAGLITAYAIQAAGIEDAAVELLAVKVLAATTAYAKHRPIRAGCADLVCKRGQQLFHATDGNDTCACRFDAFERGPFKNLRVSRGKG